MVIIIEAKHCEFIINLKCNEENNIKAQQKFEPLKKEYELCYLTDPTISVPILNACLYGNAFTFNEYVKDDEIPEKKNSPKQSFLGI